MKLCQLIDQYVTFRRALGERCVANGRVLRAFGRAVGAAADVGDVRAEDVSTFLNGTGPVTSAWHIKYNALQGFYRYAVSRGYIDSAPLPATMPKRPPPFLPYIYSREELQRLLDATGSYQRNHSCMEPTTVRTIVLLLYATALRSSEAVALNQADVQLNNSLLVVRETKFFKSRLVPFGPQLREVLAQYAARHEASVITPDGDAPFFTTRKGTRVNQNTLEGCFRRLCDHAGIRRSDGARYQPRLHDYADLFVMPILPRASCSGRIFGAVASA